MFSCHSSLYHGQHFRFYSPNLHSTLCFFPSSSLLSGSLSLLSVFLTFWMDRTWEKSMIPAFPLNEALDTLHLEMPLPVCNAPSLFTPFLLSSSQLVSFLLQIKVKKWGSEGIITIKNLRYPAWGWLSHFLLHLDLGFWVQRQNKGLSSNRAAVGFI